MAATPIEQVAQERLETYMEIRQDADQDSVRTPAEDQSVDAAWGDFNESFNEMCGTFSATRTFLHAGISSIWAQRKAREHRQDMTGLYGS
jgi:hypothetical protein